MGKRAQEELELQECAEGGGAVQTPPCSLEPFRRARWWTGGCQGVWSPHYVNSECLPGRGVPWFAPRPPCPHSLLECASRKAAGQDIPISLARHIHSCVSGKSRAPDLHTRSSLGPEVPDHSHFPSPHPHRALAFATIQSFGSFIVHA